MISSMTSLMVSRRMLNKAGEARVAQGMVEGVRVRVEGVVGSETAVVRANRRQTTRNDV